MPWRLKDPRYSARNLAELTGICRGLAAQLLEMETELHALERTLGEMVTQDQIEAGVRAGLRHADTRGWTRKERGLAYLGAACLLSDTVISLVALLRH